MARVVLPGGGIVEVFNTHLNSRGAARTSLERADRAHHYQAEESALFVNQVRDPRWPAIYGGDFNMRQAHDRIDFFSRHKRPFTLAHRFCTEHPAQCTVRQSWDNDAPWMDTQDLQLFAQGSALTIAPVAVEAMFDEPVGAAPLADHDGLLVRYVIGAPPIGHPALHAADADNMTQTGQPR